MTSLNKNKTQTPIAVFLLAIALLFSCSQSGEPDKKEGFQIFDDRLDLSLMVEDPDVVTPIGIAVDSRDRVFVLESHTHQPPKDYDGPKSDIVKVFEDSNGDGQLDTMTVFAEGIKEGLNIAFSPEGHLYVVTSKEVFVYYDRDGDGISEQSRKLLGLTEPENVYAHAAILSIAFSTDGWMYIGRGNTGGVGWVFEGTDGSRVSGYGIHPYSAWNGELPGTLPYAVALGEAPSGLLNASVAGLPKDYQNQMLCTIWEESTIVRINLQDEGVSVTGDTEVIIEGGEDFRCGNAGNEGPVRSCFGQGTRGKSPCRFHIQC